MKCRICGSTATPLWVDQHGHEWHRCSRCGSDTSDEPFAEAHKRQTHPDLERIVDYMGLTEEQYAESITENIKLFDEYQPEGEAAKEPRCFLDVGCYNGSAMRAMADRGYCCSGFELFHPPWEAEFQAKYCPKAPPQSTVQVAPVFWAGIFNIIVGPSKSAVLAREVVEHADDPRYFLHQCFDVMRPGAVLQVQTPRTMNHPHPIPYQHNHMCIFSPSALWRVLTDMGLKVLKEKLWQEGQLWLCRKIK